MTLQTWAMTLESYSRLATAVGELPPDGAGRAVRTLLPLHAPHSGYSIGTPHCQTCQKEWPCREVFTIAEALEVPVALSREEVPVTEAPPQGRMLSEGHVLAYTVPAEATYAHILTEAQRNSLDVYSHCLEGGVEWEIIFWGETVGRDNHVRMSMFDSSFTAMAELPEFFQALHIEKPASLDHVRHILDQMSAWDRTPRYAPPS